MNRLVYTSVGGRLTKWKGKVVSFAPHVSGSIAIGALASAILFADGASAQVAYTQGATPPLTLSSYELASGGFQQNGAGSMIEAMITSGAVTSTSSGTATSFDTLSNKITATAVGNLYDNSLDIVTLAGTGAGSNGVIAAAMESAANDIFASVATSNITQTLSGAMTGSAADVSNNTISASVNLARSTNILSGALSTTFANTDVGAVTVTGAAISAGAVANATAGLVLQSTQLNNDVQNATTNFGAATTFSSVATSDVSLTVSNTAGTSSLSLDSNAITADFQGNTAKNTLSVETGGMQTLSSAAGISNLQIADNVGIDVATGLVVLDSANVASSSGISAAVTGDLTTTSVELTNNTLAATSAQNTASNTLYLADGISTLGQTTYGATTATLTAPATVAGATSAASAADLFVSNVQSSVDSAIRSVNGTSSSDADGITLSSTGAATGVALDLSLNAVTATATGNKNTGNLYADGANSLDGIVTQTNVQSFRDVTTDAATADAAAIIYNPLISSTVGTTGTIALDNTSVSVVSNKIDAAATANTTTMVTSLTGNDLTDGLGVQTGTGVTSVTDTVAGTATVTAGFSSINAQTVVGDANQNTAVVTSSISDSNNGTVLISAGSKDATITDTFFDMSRNTISSSAKANTAAQTLLINANTLTASSSVVGLQTVVGSLNASLSGTTMGIDVTSDGFLTDGLSTAGTATAISNVVLSADQNAAVASVSGNTATNTMSVTATSLTAIDTLKVALVDGSGAATTELTDDRTILSLDGISSNDSEVFAQMAMLNTQRSTDTGSSTDAITASISDSGITAELTLAPSTTTSSANDNTVSASTLSVDSNAIGATARANTATNTMTLNIGSMDLTAGVYGENPLTSSTSYDLGTNIGSLGSSQYNGLAVSSTLDASGTGGTDLTASVTDGTGTIDGSSLSVSSNALTTLAAGNSVTNTFSLIGTTVSTPEANAGPAQLTLTTVDSSAGDLVAKNAAFAVGNDQFNEGNISSSIGTGTNAGTNLLQASITGTRTIEGSILSVDSNRVIAQAIAASDATTSATLDATSIATSFLAGSRQLNKGSVTATVGDADVDSTSGLSTASTVKIQAITGTTATVNNMAVSTSDNTIGASATALADISRVLIGGSSTTTVAGGGNVNAEETAASSAIATDASLVNTTTNSAVADFALILGQTNAGAVTAEAESVNIDQTLGVVAGGSVLENNRNLVTSIATAASGANTIDSKASGSNTASTALIATQTNGGAVVSTVTAPSLTTGLASITSSAAEIGQNTVAATATGLTDTNSLSVTGGSLASNVAAATFAPSTVVNGALWAPVLSTTMTPFNVTGSFATLVSTQYQNAAVTATIGDSDLTTTTGAGTQPKILLAITGATSGSDLAVTSNNFAASATVGTVSNNLSLLSDTSINAADKFGGANLVSLQNGGTGANALASIQGVNVQITGTTATNSTLGITGNDANALATGLTAFNTSALSAGTSLTGDAGGGGVAVSTDVLTVTETTSVLANTQSNVGTVKAELLTTATTAPKMNVVLSGGITASSVDISDNTMRAQANGVTAQNVSTLSAGLMDNMGAAVSNDQSQTTGAVGAYLGGPEMLISSAGPGTGTLSTDTNIAVASSTATSAVNRLTANADTSIDGVAGALTLSTLTTNSTAFSTTKATTLLNRQSSTAAVTSTIGTSAVAGETKIGTTVTGLFTGSITADSNTILAQSLGNTSDSALSMNAGTSVSADTQGVLASLQTSTGAIEAKVSGSTLASIKVTSTGLTGSASASDNTIRASSSANTTQNDLSITSATGNYGLAIDIASSGMDSAGVLTSKAQYAALISQKNSSAVTADVAKYQIGIDTSASTAATSGSLSLNGNTVMADGTASSGVNSVSSVSSGTNRGATSLLAFQSNAAAGDVTSTITNAALKTNVGTLSAGSSVEMTMNRLTAAATGLTNTNTLTVSGSEIAQATGGTPVGNVNLIGAALTVSDTSSVLANSQSNAGDAIATVNSSAASSILANVVGTTITSSAIDISNNAIRAQSNGVTAQNIANLSGGLMTDVTAGVTNYQEQTGATTATLDTPKMVITAAANVTGSGTLSTDGNLAVASATAANAVNRLSVTSDTSVDGTGATNLTSKAITTASSTLDSPTALTLLNSQTGSGGVTSLINNDAAIGTTIAGTFTGSITADKNLIVSQSRGNVADSGLVINAGTSVSNSTQAVVASSQDRTAGAISATVSGSSVSSLGGIQVTTGTASTGGLTGTASVSDNTIRASGSANTALNAMSVVGAAGVDAVSTAGAGSSITSVGAISSTAQYAVLNGQKNASAVNATLTDYQIGLNTSAGTNSGSLSLNGNMMMADATGNNAVNSLMLTAGGAGTDASGSISNYQSNTAAMIANVRNVGVVIAAGATTGSVSVANNAISASAIGNSATSVIGTAGSTFQSY